MGEIGKLFIQGLKDHMPAKKAIRLIGEDAEGWEEITRLDLDTYSDLDIKIISSSIEMKNSQLKKEARMKVLDAIAANPIEAAYVNPRGIVEEKLRSGGEFDDSEIAVLMDTKNYGNKEETAYAHKAIQDIIAGAKPDLYYGATTLFLEIVYDYARNYRTKIGNKKYLKFMDYIDAHTDIVKENLDRKAKDESMGGGGTGDVPVPGVGGSPLPPKMIPPTPMNTPDMGGSPASAGVKGAMTRVNRIVNQGVA